jgi:hypothetical protein
MYHIHIHIKCTQKKREPVEILFLIRIVIYIHIKTIFITFFFVDISHVHVYGTFFFKHSCFFFGHIACIWYVTEPFYTVHFRIFYTNYIFKR